VSFPIEPFRNLSENIIGMPETVEIVREVRVYDDRGSWTDVPQVAETTKGRLESLSASEVTRYGQFVEGAEAKITLPFGTDVDSEDKLRITTRTHTNRETEAVEVEEWDITGIPAGSDAYAADVQCMVRRSS